MTKVAATSMRVIAIIICAALVVAAFTSGVVQEFLATVVFLLFCCATLVSAFAAQFTRTDRP